MSTPRNILIGITSIISAAFILLLTYLYVDIAQQFGVEENINPQAGIPFAIGFGVSGSALALFFIYLGYRFIGQWNSYKVLQALRILILVGIIATIGSCVGFIAVTGLFGPSGAFAVIFSLTLAPVLLHAIGKIIKDLPNAR